MGLEARIWALRLGFGPRDWDLDLETGIWASRLGFEGGYEGGIVAKVLDGQPCLSRFWLKLRGEQGSGPEGVDDLCFHTYGEFSPPSPPSPASLPLKSQSQGPNFSLAVQIPVSRLKSQPRKRKAAFSIVSRCSGKFWIFLDLV